MPTLQLDGQSLTVHQVAQLAFDPTIQIALAPDAIAQMNASRQVIEGWVEKGRVIYGVTTGFGEFANVVISRENLERLQENLIRSHAVGAGSPIELPVMRAMMALRINARQKASAACAFPR